MTAPKRALLVKKDLDGLIASVIERGIGDDFNFSVLRRTGSSWEVTYGGAEHVSIALGDIEYSDIHRELSEKRSYNAKFLDGGLLQLMYRFEDERLLQHRLAYYPSPDLRPFQDDPEAYMRDELYIDIVSRRIVPFPLRFDFDDREGAHKDGAHPKSHLTLGDIKDCRVPVTSPLTPRWFVEFVLRNFYQTEEHNFVTALPKHLFHFEESISAKERTLIHFCVPAQA
ncbi:DUF2290 domain-containing protein [Bradyrhizobium sp. USDA 10063]